MKVRCTLIIALLVGLSSMVRAQPERDSLYRIWQDPSRSDSVRVKAYKDHIWNGYLFSDPDSAMVLAEALFTYAEAHDYPIAANQAHTLIGIAYEMKGEWALAMEHVLRSIAANEAIGNKWGVSEGQIMVGVLYDEQGNYPRALEHYNKALLIDEEIGNKEGMAMSLNNIGNIHIIQGHYSRALEYYQRALEIDEELGVRQGVAAELANIGEIHKKQGNIGAALENFERALTIDTEIGDVRGAATAIRSIGQLHQLQGDHALALEKYEEALAMLVELGNPSGIAAIRSAIGRFYLEQERLALAVDHCAQSLAIAEEIGALDVQNTACKCLYKAYKAMGNSSKALEFYEQMIVVRDSIYNEENTKKLTRIEMQYEFDRKETAARAEQEKKDAIAKQELQRQKLVRNGFMGGFAVVLLFAGVFFAQRNKIKAGKKQSDELLLNILPEEVAEELKEKGSSDAQLIDQVTVLFTDFKGFTAMSELVTPKQLVKDLHECFSAFDHICAKHGLEKIKTIGDAYMAAGGLPTPNTTHATDVIQAAFEMRDFIAEGKARKIAAGLPYFEIRIGVHTGPVVAGIVGVKKFQYDIWGDTVNTASRMESSGEVGMVNISEATYRLVNGEWSPATGGNPHSPVANSPSPAFTFTSRGKIQAKGKGELEMYFVERSWEIAAGRSVGARMPT